MPFDKNISDADPLYYSYDKWLEGLSSYFFGPHMAGKRVRLTVDGQFLDNHFSHIGGSEAFINTLSSDPDWLPVQSRSLDHRVTLINKCWQNSEEGHPVQS